MGLLDTPPAAIRDQLRGIARKNKSIECRRMAVWALRALHKQQPDSQFDDRELMLEILRETTSTAIGTEVITAMGVIGGDQNLAALTDIVRFGQQTWRLPVFAAAMDRQPVNQNIGGCEPGCMRAAACLALTQLSGASAADW